MEFSLARNFIEFNGVLLEILHSFDEKSIKDRDGLKSFLECDRILRKDTKLLFCKAVEEAKIVPPEDPNRLSNETTKE